MASSGKKERSQLFIALNDMSKRIPVVKLERVDTLYSTFKKATHKSLVSSDKADEGKRKELSYANKEFDRLTGESNDCGTSVFSDSYNEECQVDISISSEPPKKHYKLGKETAECDSLLSRASVPKQLSVVIEEGKTTDKNSVPQNCVIVKSEVVTIECDSNALLTFPRNDECAVGPLSLLESKRPVIKSETDSGNDDCELYLKTYEGKNDSKLNSSVFWERKRPGTEALVFSGTSGTEINMPTFSGNDVQTSGNIKSRIDEHRFFYTENNGSGINPLSCSGINRPHRNLHVYGGSTESGISPSVYSGPGINQSAYVGNSGSGINSPAYTGNSGHGINTASYPMYNRPGYTQPVCSGNNGLGINYLAFSGSDKSEINPSYSGNNGVGINSLTYSGSRSMMIPRTYCGNNGPAITPQTYSGNGSRVNLLSYSGNNGPGINAQTYSGNNESGMNTVMYSSNSGPTINSSYCGSKGLYPVNTRDELNSPTYTGNNISGINSPSCSRNSGLKINSPAYPGNNGPTVNSSAYSRNDGTGINSPTYSGNNGSGVNQMRFLRDRSFGWSEVAQQYEILQSYCDDSESGTNNMACQETTWSNDYITLNSLPTNEYEMADCSQDFSYLFSCRVCGSMSAVADELIKHWRLHTGVDSLTCTVCCVSFTDVLFLQAHWKATHMGGECSDSGVVLRNEPEFLPQLVCEACGFAFVQFSSLEQHVMSTHVPVTRHRESVFWRSSNTAGSLYSVTNTQQNNIISSKSPQDSPVLNNHSVTKQFTVLKSNLLGSGGHGHSVAELVNNVMETNVTEHFMTRHPAAVVSKLTETDDESEVETENDLPSSTDSTKFESVSGQNGKLFKCKVCESNSGDVNDLMKHWRIHIGANSMTCTICKKTFSDLPFLQAHWRRSHMQGNPLPISVSRSHLLHSESSFICDACGYAFPDFAVLEQHLLSTHVVGGSTHVPLKSRNCADNTQTISDMQKQNMMINKTKSLDLITLKIQVMNHCKKKGAEKQPETKGHKESQDVVVIEESTKKVIKCSDLGSKRTKNSDWCLVCGETSDDMIKHLVTHTGVLSLECCLCGKDFVDIPFLQAHWRATHMNGDVCYTNNCIYVGNYKENVSCKQKLLCETCGCYVPQLSALEKHIILTHTVIKPPYECKCEDVFSSQDELKRHILTCSW